MTIVITLFDAVKVTQFAYKFYGILGSRHYINFLSSISYNDIIKMPKSNAQKNTKILSSQIIRRKNEKQTIMVTPPFFRVFLATLFHIFQNGQK